MRLLVFLAGLLGVAAKDARRQQFDLQTWSSQYTSIVPVALGAAGNSQCIVMNSDPEIPAAEFQDVRVTVDIDLLQVQPSALTLALQYPTGTVQLLLSGQCAGAAKLLLTFSPAGSALAGLPCNTGAVVLPQQLGALTFPNALADGQQCPDTSSANTQWALCITTPGNIVLNSWALQFNTFCSVKVPNEATMLGAGVTSTQDFPVQCLPGYLSTSINMFCLITGPTPVACTIGGAGGALITWGINVDADIQQALVTTQQLGRPIPMRNCLRYDRHMNYAWIPNGMVVTQVALGAEGTLALTRDGTVFVWGRFLPATLPALLYYDNPTIPIVQTPFIPNAYFTTLPAIQRFDGTQVAFPAGVVVTQIYASGAYTYAALAAGGPLFMWGLNDAGQLGQDFRTVPWLFEPTPVVLPSNVQVAHVALTYATSGLVSTVGDVWMWGSNAYFNQGRTYNYRTLVAEATAQNAIPFVSQTFSFVPARVGYNVMPRTMMKLAVIHFQAASLTCDGQLWYWGTTARAYYYGRVDWPSYFPNHGTLNLNDLGFIDGGLGIPLNPATDLLGGDFIAPRPRDTANRYTVISGNAGAFGALSLGGMVYTWGVDLYRDWQLFPISTRIDGAVGGEFDEILLEEIDDGCAAFPCFDYTGQTGVLGRELLDGEFYDEDLGAIDFTLSTNRAFVRLAMGGSFGIAQDNLNVVYQWGNTFVDNFDPTYTLWADSETTPFAVPPPLPNDIITYLAAGEAHAAALDLRTMDAGCPITQPLMTSQDLNFIRALTFPVRGKFVASMTVISVCRSANWVNTFVPVGVLTPRVPWNIPMPTNNNNGVTMQVTNWNCAYYVVFTTFTPTGASTAALGIIPSRNRELLWLVAWEQMYPDAAMWISHPLYLQIRSNDLEVIICYEDAYRAGKPLAGELGSWTYVNNVASLVVQHPSACAGYGHYATDESNEALLGLLGLIALPLLCCLGLLGYLWWKYTTTAAVMEGVNPVVPVYALEPTAMPMQSPAFTPGLPGPGYLPSGGYLPNPGYLAPTFM